MLHRTRRTLHFTIGSLRKHILQRRVHLAQLAISRTNSLIQPVFRNTVFPGQLHQLVYMPPVILRNLILIGSGHPHFFISRLADTQIQHRRALDIQRQTLSCPAFDFIPQNSLRRTGSRANGILLDMRHQLVCNRIVDIIPKLRVNQIIGDACADNTLDVIF